MSHFSVHCNTKQDRNTLKWQREPNGRVCYLQQMLNCHSKLYILCVKSFKCNHLIINYKFIFTTFNVYQLCVKSSTRYHL